MHSRSYRARALAVALALSVFLPTLLTAATAAYSQVDNRTFPETGHNIKGDFLRYWDSHGQAVNQYIASKSK